MNTLGLETLKFSHQNAKSEQRFYEHQASHFKEGNAINHNLSYASDLLMVFQPENIFLVFNFFFLVFPPIFTLMMLKIKHEISSVIRMKKKKKE